MEPTRSPGSGTQNLAAPAQQQSAEALSDRPTIPPQQPAPQEGKLAKAIERRTAKVPSDLYLWAAGAALVSSACAQFFGGKAAGGAGRAPMATFVGLWVPSLLLLGVYNKIVKVAGSDRMQTLGA